MKIFIVLAVIFSVGLCQQQSFRLCVYPSEATLFCDDLNKANIIQCVRVADSLECVSKLLTGQVDFGVLESEQALLQSGFISDKTVVVAEIRSRLQEISKHNFQMVVVVKKSHTGGLNGLRGKKYCHPGFSSHVLWTPRTLKEFENVLFKDQLKQSCDSKQSKSYIEREIDVINNFFGDSCRIGPWTNDRTLNYRLQKKYSKLTALCDDNTKTDSLKCLKLKHADLAYTTLHEALKLQDKDEYRLLCKNGSLSTINHRISDECSWRNQPWSLLIARREKGDDIKNVLNNSIKTDYRANTQGGEPYGNPKQNFVPWADTVANILLKDIKEYGINIFSDSFILKDFLRTNNQLLDPLINADCPMRWCTVSEKEQNKCSELARASLYAGIEPQISCIQGSHIYDCLKNIKNNNADVIAIDSNYGYLARKMGLQNLLYSENSKDDIASIITVIPEESLIQNFNDLKNKKACFPEYRGLAWVSFIDSAHAHKVMKDSCEFGKSVSDFFSGICAPGAKDNHHYRQNNEVYDKLCSLCSDNCESNTNNRYFNNSGSLSCLADRKADVAFVEWQEIYDEPNLRNYKILCDNEIIPFDIFPEYEELCVLSSTVDSEVIVRQNDSRKSDYKHALLYIDNLFGTGFRNAKTINVFKDFNGEKNLLFKENVLGLTDDRSDNTYVQNYVNLFENVEKCTSTSDSAAVIASIINLIVSSLFVFMLRKI